MQQKSGSTQKSQRCALHEDCLTIGSYVVLFDTERRYQRPRYHWVICKEQKPEELVVWGHASTRVLAEQAARSAIEKLR
jgi:hypothetical protein